MKANLLIWMVELTDEQLAEQFPEIVDGTPLPWYLLWEDGANGLVRALQDRVRSTAVSYKTSASTSHRNRRQKDQTNQSTGVQTASADLGAASQPEPDGSTAPQAPETAAQEAPNVASASQANPIPSISDPTSVVPHPAAQGTGAPASPSDVAPAVQATETQIATSPDPRVHSQPTTLPVVPATQDTGVQTASADLGAASQPEPDGSAPQAPETASQQAPNVASASQVNPIPSISDPTSVVPHPAAQGTGAPASPSDVAPAVQATETQIATSPDPRACSQSTTLPVVPATQDTSVPPNGDSVTTSQPAHHGAPPLPDLAASAGLPHILQRSIGSPPAPSIVDEVVLGQTGDASSAADPITTDFDAPDGYDDSVPQVMFEDEPLVDEMGGVSVEDELQDWEIQYAAGVNLVAQLDHVLEQVVRLPVLNHGIENAQHDDQHDAQLDHGLEQVLNFPALDHGIEDAQHDAQHEAQLDHMLQQALPFPALEHGMEDAQQDAMQLVVYNGPIDEELGHIEQVLPFPVIEIDGQLCYDVAPLQIIPPGHSDDDDEDDDYADVHDDDDGSSSDAPIHDDDDGDVEYAGWELHDIRHSHNFNRDPVMMNCAREFEDREYMCMLMNHEHFEFLDHLNVLRVGIVCRPQGDFQAADTEIWNRRSPMVLRNVNNRALEIRHCNSHVGHWTKTMYRMQDTPIALIHYQIFKKRVHAVNFYEKFREELRATTDKVNKIDADVREWIDEVLLQLAN